MHNAARAHSVITVDPNYIHPGRAAVYLINADGPAAFVDASTPRSLAILLRALEERGLRPEQVEYVVVTHVHLDHSAGTAALLGACPNAVALVHPRGARHLAAPARLVESAKRVYGEEVFDSLYGAVEAVAAERVRTVEDGEILPLGDGELRFLHTPGHAKHHISVYDSGSNGVFTGDAFGVAYPPVQHGTRKYLLCSCTPTDFDAEAARETVRRIVDTGAERAYLTQFGPFESVK
ncbi:MAG: MBL fold metallo-hydrolase, partial [FCB group bacterium]|nr:MBL fold metallo-hydrolase [FCB group bacterium]